MSAICYTRSMARGIIYIMTTVVPGIVKIGKAQAGQYKERMRYLEKHGYGNVTGLKQYFAIELEDYDEKERLLHEIFNKHQVGDSELFALEKELAKQLFLALDGTVVYPKNIDKEREFDEVTEKRKQGPLFNFYTKGLKSGDVITFVADSSIAATVVNERDVEYEGEISKLSPLTGRIFEHRGAKNKSGAYQGAAYWVYGDTKLKDLPDIDQRE